MTDKKYFGSLDVAKFIAAVIVALFFHYRVVMFGEVPFYKGAVMKFIYDYGWLGVEFFFFVSGFFAYYHSADKLIEGSSAADFLIAKIIRIYPAMILSVIAAAAGQWLTYVRFGKYFMIEDHQRNSLTSFILSILGIQSGWFTDLDAYSINGPCWYISILMICYLIFAICIRMFGSRKNRLNLSFIIIMIAGVCCEIRKPDMFLAFSSNGRGYICFFGGALIAEYYMSGRMKGKQRIWIMAVSVVLISFFIGMYHFGVCDDICFDFTFLAAPEILLLLLCLKQTGDHGHVNSGNSAENRICRSLGAISFDIYLLNFPLGIWTIFVMETFGIRADTGSLSFFTFFAVMTIATAVLFHYLVEVPLTKRLSNGH